MEIVIILLLIIIIIGIYEIIYFIKNKYFKHKLKKELNNIEGIEFDFPFLLDVVKNTKKKWKSVFNLFGKNKEINWVDIGKNIQIENGKIKYLKLKELYLKDNEVGYNIFNLSKNLIKSKKLKCLIGFQILSNESKFLKEKNIFGNLYFGKNVTNLGKIEKIITNNYEDVFSNDEDLSFFDDFNEEIHYDIASKIVNGTLEIKVDNEEFGELEFHINTRNSKLLKLEAIPGDLYIVEGEDKDETKEFLSGLGKIKNVKGNIYLDSIRSKSIFNIVNFINKNHIEYKGEIDFDMDNEGLLFGLEKIPGNLGIYIDEKDLYNYNLENFKRNYQNIKIKEISGELIYNKNTNYGKIIEGLIKNGKLKASKIETYGND